MKNKKLMLTVIAILIIVISICCFFIKNNYKTVKFGNNNYKSAEDIKEYILNISSYEADITVEIISNKNSNKYKIKQKYSSPNIFKQEVIEPDNIQGLTTTFDGTTLKIDNTKLSLNKIFENYSYVSENSLCLNDFIKDYKESKSSKIKEEVDNIIMETKIEDGNKYIAYKKLYIDRKTNKPIKLEIEDINKKMLVYIQYNEIKINSLNKDEVLAFKLKMEEENI